MAQRSYMHRHGRLKGGKVRHGGNWVFDWKERLSSYIRRRHFPKPRALDYTRSWHKPSDPLPRSTLHSALPTLAVPRGVAESGTKV